MDGGKSPSIRRYWAPRPGTACRPSGSASCKGLRTFPEGLTLTADSMLSAVNLSRARKIPISVPCPPGPLSIKECSWWASCADSMKTCRAKPTKRPLPWSTPDSPPIPCPAGKGPIPTASLPITVRSIPSGATRTVCWPEKRPCIPPSCRLRGTKFIRLSQPAAPIPPCWIIPWNSST